MENHLIKSYLLPASLCDNTAHLSIPDIFSLFMDLASEHGAAMHLGMDDLAEKGLIWLTLDKRAITARASVMLAGDTTPKDYRMSEVFTVSNRPYAVSDIWNAPRAPSSFYVAHDADGYPRLHFKAADAARYRIQRDAIGESVILTEISGTSGQTVTYSDHSAIPGVLYTYRIIPIHEELLQQGIWLEGKQAVQLAQVADSSSSGFLAGLRSLLPVLSNQANGQDKPQRCNASLRLVYIVYGYRLLNSSRFASIISGVA